LRKEFKKAVTVQDYGLAEKLHSAEVALIHDPSEDVRKVEEQKSREKSISERINQTRTRITEIQEYRAAKQRKFESVTSDRTQEIEERHCPVSDDFEIHGNKRTTILAFNKASSQLMELRRQQQICRIHNDFHRSRDRKKRADELETLETTEAEWNRDDCGNQCGWKEIINNGGKWSAPT
jgi:hypothetical protein